MADNSSKIVTRRLALILAAGLILGLTPACMSRSSQAGPGEGSEPGSQDPTSTTTTSSSPASMAEGPKAGSDRSCFRQEPVSADVDGDSREDYVFHTWVKGRALLSVCTARGRNDSRPGLGQAEMLQIIDVNDDGRDEIFFGSNTCCMGELRIAVFIRGGLRLIRDSQTRGPLAMRQGIDIESHHEIGLAFGCEDLDGDGTRDIAQVKARAKGRRIYWKKVGFTLTAKEARRVGARRGSQSKVKGQSLQEVASQQTSECSLRVAQ